MQPLYDIGLAIRQHRLEVDTNKPNAEKDLLAIGKGNMRCRYYLDDGVPLRATIQTVVQLCSAKEYEKMRRFCFKTEVFV